MGNYAPSTIERIGDINRGVVVRTSVFANLGTILATKTQIFQVNGRIRLLSLDYEAVTAFSNTATLMQWQFDMSSPAVATADISAAALTCAQIAQGRRVVWQGTAQATAPVISTDPGISIQAPNTMDIGCESGVGTIDVVGAVAATSGTGLFTLTYVPISEGAYVTALV